MPQNVPHSPPPGRRRAAPQRDRGIYKRGKRYWLKWYVPGVGTQRAALVPVGQKLATTDLHVARLLASRIRKSGLTAQLTSRRPRRAPTKAVRARAGQSPLGGEIQRLVEGFRLHNRSRGRASDDQVARNVASVRAYLQAERIRSIEQITPASIDAHLSRLERRGLAPSTINKAKVAVSGFCRLLVLRGLLGGNPAREVPAATVKLPPPRFLSPAEIKTVLETADAAGLGVEVRTALWTGMRRGELAGLDWPDVKWDQQMIVLTKTKTNRPRSIPLPKALVNALAEHALASRGQARPATGRVFVGDDHKPRSYWFWRRGLNPVQTAVAKFSEVNGTGRGWHLLRHTYCSRLVQAGVPLKKIQEWAGHSSIATTLRYAHLQPSYDADVERVADLGEGD